MTNYRVQSNVSEKEWERFLLKNNSGLFVQSSLSGQVHKKMGEDFSIIGVYKKNVLVGGSLVLFVHAKRGDFLLLPYGPILDYQDTSMVGEFVGYIKKFGRAHGCDFVRISPFVEDTSLHRELLISLGLKKAPMHVLAENTWILDTKKTESDIFSAMRKNHRNLIRRCEKNGVVVKKTTSPDALARLNEMHDVVAKRHKFHRFSRSFVENEFRIFSKKGKAYIFEAYLPDGRLDASAMIIFYNNMACYRHSASLNQDRRLPTSYLIQWKVIKAVKKADLSLYNFWGVAPKNAPKNHPFSGITHFKQGFGGEQKDLLPCMDLPLTKKYYMNWLIETFRRVKRGF